MCFKNFSHILWFLKTKLGKGMRGGVHKISLSFHNAQLKVSGSFKLLNRDQVTRHCFVNSTSRFTWLHQSRFKVFCVYFSTIWNLGSFESIRPTSYFPYRTIPGLLGQGHRNSCFESLRSVIKSRFIIFIKFSIESVLEHLSEYTSGKNTLVFQV